MKSKVMDLTPRKLAKSDQSSHRYKLSKLEW